MGWDVQLRIVEQLGEDFSQILAFLARPSSIAEPSAQRLPLAFGKIPPSAFPSPLELAHLPDGHTLALPPARLGCSGAHAGRPTTWEERPPAGDRRLGPPAADPATTMSNREEVRCQPGLHAPVEPYGRC